MALVHPEHEQADEDDGAQEGHQVEAVTGEAEALQQEADNLLLLAAIECDHMSSKQISSLNFQATAIDCLTRGQSRCLRSTSTKLNIFYLNQYHNNIFFFCRPDKLTAKLFPKEQFGKTVLQ